MAYYLLHGFTSKAKLLGHVLTAIDVLNNVNLNKILKFDLDYKELGYKYEHLKTI
jgi:hypothetical protein